MTGTRVPPPNLEGSSPVLSLGAGEIARDGPLPIEQILANLPSVQGETSSMLSFSNASFLGSGTSTVGLRGLGAARSLVLVNGRRLGAASPLVDAADLNQIPTALIKRVDVLTGGASAVYGSDAIAGVINFIMNDHFEGVQGEISHSFHSHRQQNPRGIADIIAANAVTNPSQYKVPGDKSSDGESTVAKLTVGGNFAGGKGNATAFLGYREDKALLHSERDYSACVLSANASGLICRGQTSSYPGLFIVGNRSLTVADSAGNVRPWVLASDAYNTAPTNYFRRPTERHNAAAFADYAVTPATTIYAELSYHDDRTVAQIAETPLGAPVTVRYENPLLSDDWRRQLALGKPGDSVEIVLQRRNIEGGARQDERRHTSSREVIGVRGAVGEHWTYDAYFQAGKVEFEETYRNDLSRSRALRSLDVVADPATGRPVCRSALDGSDPACVPYDIWRLGGVTPEALAYLRGSGLAKGSTSHQVIGASASADLGRYGIRFPGMQEGASVALGVERRREDQRLEADAAYSVPDLASIAAVRNTSGGYVAKEAFGEIRLPILDSLSVNGSYRYSDYSTGNQTDTFGAGFDFFPARQVRLRGSVQRAVRAPGVGELFSPQLTLPLGVLGGDPCDGPAPSRPLEECRRTGVTEAQYGRIVVNPASPSAANVRVGGSPDLAPESGSTFTIGAVLTPAQGFSATIDYVDIRLEDAIGSAGQFISMQNCLSTGEPLYCDRIHRDPVSGTLWLGEAVIVDTLDNLATLRTTGVDLGVNYVHRIDGGGRIAISALGTYVRSFAYEPSKDVGEIDCSGYFNCQNIVPKWRHQVRATWSTAWKIDLSATWRYVDEVANVSTNPSPVVAAPTPEAARKVEAASFIDVSAAWEIDRRFTVSAGISNVLDRPPPLFPGAGNNGNTYVNLYDALGRRFWLTVTGRF